MVELNARADQSTRTAISCVQPNPHRPANLNVTAPTLISLQMIAANDDGQAFSAILDGVALEVQEIRGPEQYPRQHLVRVGIDPLTISYQATMRPGPRAAAALDEAEQVMMMRPHR